jgi:glycosyltransferase involved in cell wall biosynthesis
VNNVKKIIIIQSIPFNQNIRAHKIAKNLIENGYQVGVLGWNRGSKSNRKERWMEDGKIQEIQLGIRAPLGSIVVAFYPLWWCFVFLRLMIENWDLTYAINLESVPPALIAGKIKKRPVVYENLDDHVNSLILPNVIRNSLINIDKLFMRFVNGVVLADDMQVEMLSGIPNSRVVVIYDSPDDNYYTVIKENRPSQKFTLFYAGGLSSARALNLDKAIDAVKSLEGVKITIAGYGDLAIDIENLSKEFPEKVEFLGTISHSEVLRRTFGADLLFLLRSPQLPVNKFICGSKLLQAMMCGRPILVNKGTSTAKKVLEENCGIVVDANNIEEIKNAIIMLRDHPRMCEELGANGRIAYEARYSWAIMERRLLILFRELTEK